MFALELRQLEKTYANGVKALQGIDLAVKPGDFFALLGVNGAGKSTTIGLISTLLTKTAGKIFVQGVDLDLHPEQVKSYLGLVPQEFNLNVFETCEQILINQGGYYGIPRQQAKERSEELLKQLDLWPKRKTIVRHLSGGMKRRLMIARALIHEPKVLILDEPTAGIDIEIRRIMWNFFKKTNEAGTTIILTTHYLEEAEQLCKNIAIIHHGRIIENSSITELLKKKRHQTFVFNTLHPLVNLPETINGFSIQQIESQSFELRAENDCSLNDIFTNLSKHQITVTSMRNKTNRIEELFLDLIRHDQ